MTKYIELLLKIKLIWKLNFYSPHQDSSPYDNHIFNVREQVNSNDIHFIIHVSRIWYWENNE